MITVKHIIDDANEAVYEGTHVRYHKCHTTNCIEATGITIFNDDDVVTRVAYDGHAYVMNSDGQTIAHYFLPDEPSNDKPDLVA